MSASESAAVVAPVEEVKPTVATVEPAAADVVAEVVTPAVEAMTATEPIATEGPPMSESKAVDEPKKDAPKTSIFTRFLNPFKGGEKKTKAPKSPKKEMKKEKVVEATATAEETHAPEVSAEVVETAVAAEAATTEVATTEVPAVVTEEVKETTTKETPVMPKADAKALKVGRRLSARVGDFFKSKPKSEVTTPAKVDEYPPMITAPEAIGPLEHPAKVEEPPKVEASAPVVAATA